MSAAQPSSAACSIDTASPSGIAAAASTTTRSASAPVAVPRNTVSPFSVSPVRPPSSVPRPIADESGPHAAGRPRRQAPHSPHDGAQERTTRSPSRQAFDLGSDRLDEPGALVAEDDRRRPVPLALVGVEVGAADADGAHAHDDLAGQRLLDVELLDDERARLVHDGRERLHRISIPPLTSSVAPVTNAAASEAR